MSDLDALVPDVDATARRARRRRLPGRPRAGHGAVLRRPPAAAAPARGRGRRGQDRGRQGAGRAPRHPARPAAVLRGHRRRRGAVRVELPAPAARHPAGRGRRARRSTSTTCSAATTSSSGRCCRPSSIPGPGPAVLLIDEVDRADDEFEAFLFELLAESPVTIPELGTLRAAHPADRGPHVEPHPRPPRRAEAALPLPLDRLPRRSTGPWRSSAAGCRPRRSTLAEQVAAAVARLRSLDVQKPPGIAEAINWVAALELLGLDRLDAAGGRADARARC